MRTANASNAEERHARVVHEVGPRRFIVVSERAILLVVSMTGLSLHGLWAPAPGSAAAASLVDYLLAPAAWGSVALLQLGLLVVYSSDHYCDPHLSVVWDGAAVFVYMLLLAVKVHKGDKNSVNVALPPLAATFHLITLAQDGVWIARVRSKLRSRVKPWPQSGGAHAAARARGVGFEQSLCFATTPISLRSSQTSLASQPSLIALHQVRKFSPFSEPSTILMAEDPRRQGTLERLSRTLPARLRREMWGAKAYSAGNWASCGTLRSTASEPQLDTPAMYGSHFFEEASPELLTVMTASEQLRAHRRGFEGVSHRSRSLPAPTIHARRRSISHSRRTRSASWWRNIVGDPGSWPLSRFVYRGSEDARVFNRHVSRSRQHQWAAVRWGSARTTSIPGSVAAHSSLFLRAQSLERGSNYGGCSNACSGSGSNRAISPQRGQGSSSRGQSHGRDES